MRIDVLTYDLGAGIGDATVIVWGYTTEFNDILFAGTVNFEFKVDKYETGDGYLTPIENWMDVEITDIEYFDDENRRVKPKYNVQEAIEYELIEKIKDNEN